MVQPGTLTMTLANLAVGKPRASSPATPWLYYNSQDVTQYLASDSKNPQGAVGVGGKIYAVGSINSGSAFLFENSAWAVKATGIEATAAIKMSFVDSRGYFFASWDGPAGKIMRSVDGGTTWTASLTFPRTADYCLVMTESDNGWLFAHAYSAEAAPTATIALYRSKDGGTTWENITANLALTVNRHIHGCFWDNHRKLLFVTHGDAGAASKVQVSSNYGDSFSSWASTFQCTGITADADYIYLSSDQAGDVKIYRAVGRTIAEVIAATPVAVFDPTTLLASPGFSTWAHIDEYGHIIFPYNSGTAALLLVSADHGATWVNVLGAGHTFGATFAKEQMQASQFANFDGFFYGRSTNYRLVKWRIYPGGTEFRVAATGADYTKDGVTYPWLTVPAYAINSGVSVKLESDYAPTLFSGLNGLKLNKNGYNLTAATPGAPGFSDGFEGAAPFAAVTNGTVTLDQASTLQAHAGTRCLRADLGAGSAGWYAYGESTFFTGQTTNAILWTEFWVYVEVANVTQVVTLWKMTNGSYLYFPGGTNPPLAFTSGPDVLRQNGYNQVAFPRNQWVHIKIRQKLAISAWTGETTVWQDDKVIIHAVGVKTHVGVLTTTRFGAESSQAIIVNFDDIRMALTTDPEQPTALTLRGTGQSVIPDGIYR